MQGGPNIAHVFEPAMEHCVGCSTARQFYNLQMHLRLPFKHARLLDRPPSRLPRRVDRLPADAEAEHLVCAGRQLSSRSHV
jgi:hypothetical protein